MEFILRLAWHPWQPGQRLSLVVVWANHLFLVCNYNKDLLDSVVGTAGEIEVEDLPRLTARISEKHQSSGKRPITHSSSCRLSREAGTPTAWTVAALQDSWYYQHGGRGNEDERKSCPDWCSKRSCCSRSFHCKSRHGYLFINHARFIIFSFWMSNC